MMLSHASSSPPPALSLHLLPHLQSSFPDNDEEAEEKEAIHNLWASSTYTSMSIEGDDDDEKDLEAETDNFFSHFPVSMFDPKDDNNDQDDIHLLPSSLSSSSPSSGRLLFSSCTPTTVLSSSQHWDTKGILNSTTTYNRPTTTSTTTSVPMPIMAAPPMQWLQQNSSIALEEAAATAATVTAGHAMAPREVTDPRTTVALRRRPHADASSSSSSVAVTSAHNHDPHYSSDSGGRSSIPMVRALFADHTNNDNHHHHHQWNPERSSLAASSSSSSSHNCITTPIAKNLEATTFRSPQSSLAVNPPRAQQPITRIHQRVSSSTTATTPANIQLDHLLACATFDVDTPLHASLLQSLSSSSSSSLTMDDHVDHDDSVIKPRQRKELMMHSFSPMESFSSSNIDPGSHRQQGPAQQLVPMQHLQKKESSNDRDPSPPVFRRSTSKNSSSTAQLLSDYSQGRRLPASSLLTISMNHSGTRQQIPSSSSGKSRDCAFNGQSQTSTHTASRRLYALSPNKALSSSLTPMAPQESLTLLPPLRMEIGQQGANQALQGINNKMQQAHSYRHQPQELQQPREQDPFRQRHPSSPPSIPRATSSIPPYIYQNCHEKRIIPVQQQHQTQPSAHVSTMQNHCRNLPLMYPYPSPYLVPQAMYHGAPPPIPASYPPSHSAKPPLHVQQELPQQASQSAATMPLYPSPLPIEADGPATAAAATAITTYAPKKAPNQQQPPKDRPTACTCKKSRCLKLYCDCFAANTYCSAACKCTDCCNNSDHEVERQRVMADIRSRNPRAFQPRMFAAKANATSSSSSSSTTPTPTYEVGCRCKKSECLKKYCECFGAKVLCTDLCKCVDCQNTAGSQKLIDKRRRMNDASGAYLAMKAAEEFWKAKLPIHKKQQQPAPAPQHNVYLPPAIHHPSAAATVPHYPPPMYASHMVHHPPPYLHYIPHPTAHYYATPTIPPPLPPSTTHDPSSSMAKSWNHHDPAIGHPSLSSHLFANAQTSTTTTTSSTAAHRHNHSESSSSTRNIQDDCSSRSSSSSHGTQIITSTSSMVDRTTTTTTTTSIFTSSERVEVVNTAAATLDSMTTKRAAWVMDNAKEEEKEDGAVQLRSHEKDNNKEDDDSESSALVVVRSKRLRPTDPTHTQPKTECSHHITTTTTLNRNHSSGGSFFHENHNQEVKAAVSTTDMNHHDEPEEVRLTTTVSLSR